MKNRGNSGKFLEKALFLKGFVPKDTRFLNRWSQVQLLFRAPFLNSKCHFSIFYRLSDQPSCSVVLRVHCGKIVEFFQSLFSIFSCSKNNKFTPSSGTIHLILLISTPIERKRAFYRLPIAMRLAGVGRSWEDFGKIASLPFELISGVLGNWEIFFQLHSRACAREQYHEGVQLSPPCCARAL